MNRYIVTNALLWAVVGLHNVRDISRIISSGKDDAYSIVMLGMSAFLGLAAFILSAAAFSEIRKS